MTAVRIACLLLLVLLASPVLAEDAYVDIEDRLSAEQMHDTGLDGLSPEQLALLNRLLREQQESSHAAAPARVEPDRSRLIGFTEGSVSSRIPGAVAGWRPGDEFRLENGQVWKVLKGEMTLREPLQSPQVEVVPGVAGRWFLQFHEDLPKARVYRID